MKPSLICLAFVVVCASTLAQPTPTALAPCLDLGPMLGHISSSEVSIWAKSTSRARLEARIGRQPDLSDGRTVTGPVLAEQSGFMGHLLVQGLEPEQRYYYCLLFDGRDAISPPYPFFETPPPPAGTGRVRVAFTSCVGYHGYNAAAGYADMATRTNFDLALLLGDNHYANSSDPAVQRAAYADQRRTAGYRALGSQIPIYAIWDDHDFGPDNSDGTLPGKELSLQTFREHWANPGSGEPDNPGVYYQFSRPGVDFFMLDVRYHRSPNNAPNNPKKTMLGERQLDWLTRALLDSEARVKIIAAGGEWQSHGTDDSWTAFRHERDVIFRFLREHDIRGVILLSGDRHFTGAYQVEGSWIEITAGPLGSNNARTKNLPEMFMNYDQGKLYCVLDIDTRSAEPAVTLEVYRAAEGLVERRAFTWQEILGTTKIRALPAGKIGK